MNSSFLNEIPALLICSLLLVAMLGLTLLGLRFRPAQERSSIGPLESSLFALLGLLLAFTFSMSASRYDARRTVVVTEANNIGTAVLRSDLFIDSVRLEFRKDFKGYTEARINYNLAGRDTAKVRIANDSVAKYAARLWARVASLSRNPANLIACNQMIFALNPMFDIATTRDAAIHAKVPDSILWLLFILSLCCSFFVGFVMPSDKKINWPVIIGFCLLITCVVYTILDLDRPHRGFIMGDQNEQYIRDIRQMLQ